MAYPFRWIAAATLLLGSPSMTSAADDKPSSRTVSVSGTGKLSTPPTLAQISAGVITQGGSAREALTANSDRMTALHEVLKQRGVAAKDVRTTQVSVQPQFSQPPPFQPGQDQPRDFVPKIVGYQVQNTVQITSRDLSKLGELLDAVVEAGANQMYSINFEVEKPDALLDLARKAAMADARKKAELLAGEAGVVVGPPITIRDEVPSSPPRPGVVSFRAASANASVPVAAGEQELAVTVHVVYELTTPK